MDEKWHFGQHIFCVHNHRKWVLACQATTSGYHRRQKCHQNVTGRALMPAQTPSVQGCRGLSGCRTRGAEGTAMLAAMPSCRPNSEPTAKMCEMQWFWEILWDKMSGSRLLNTEYTGSVDSCICDTGQWTAAVLQLVQSQYSTILQTTKDDGV